MEKEVDSRQSRMALPPRYPDAHLPLCFSLALVSGGLLRAGPLPAVTLLLLSAALLAAAAIVLSQLSIPVARYCLPLGALALGLSSAAFLVGPALKQGIDAAQLGAATAVEGQLVEDAARYADADTRYRLGVTRVSGRGVEYDAVGTLVVVVPGGKEYSAGRRLRVSYTAQDIWQAGDTLMLRSTSVEPLGWNSAHLRRRDTLRRRLFARIDAMGYRPGGLFRALVAGSRSRLTLEQQRLFRESGSSHLLALSGMHLGIIAAVSFGLLRLLLGRRSAFVVTLLLCVGYIYLVGARPSLLRAMAMLALGGWIRLCGRRSDPINSFALAVAVLLLLMPSLLYQLSFQLSALSILGILGPGAQLRRVIAPYLPRWPAMGLAAAAGAQLATAPLALLVFGTVYPVALLSSLIMIPMVSLFVWSGLAWLLLTAVWPQLPAAALLLADQARWIQAAARAFSHAPAAAPSVAGSSVTLTLTALSLLLLYRRAVALQQRRRAAAWPP